MPMSDSTSHPGPSGEAAASTYTLPLHCGSFPDLCLKDLKSVPEENKTQAIADNRRKDVMYRAIRYILINNFRFTDRLPTRIENFPGNLKTEEIAQYLAIHGLMLADNYNDATLGKDHRSPDDTPVDEHDARRSFFIARRFLDAVVKAVQEYSAQAELFQKVYGLLSEAGGKLNGSSSGHRASTMAHA